MANYRYTSRQRQQFRPWSVFNKTGGRCHFCGAKLRFDDNWQMDHIVQRKHGGADDVANYLPACATCNRLRWSRTGADLQFLLFIGYVAAPQMRQGETLGAKCPRMSGARTLSAAPERRSTCRVASRCVRSSSMASSSPATTLGGIKKVEARSSP
jgi:hypothetical protein